MSLSELNNPKAAAALIENFKKRFKDKICMAPHTDHEGSIVSAHTLSVEAMLRKISVNSHVYSPTQAKKFSKDQLPIEFRLMGLRDVSVFNGFCQKHDRELFSCIENNQFRFSRQQNFMLAYRAVARECYLKRKQFDVFPTAEQIAELQGIEEEVRLSDEAILFQASTLKGAEDVEFLKASFDKHLSNQAWDRLITHAIIFSETPSILGTAAFQPFFDLSQVQLQDYTNLDATMSQICVSVIPLEVGGAAIFSWLDSSNSAPRRYFESVINTKDLTATTIGVLLDNTENIAINPVWYESLNAMQKDYLYYRLMPFDFSQISGTQKLYTEEPQLDNWGTTIISQF